MRLDKIQLQRIHNFTDPQLTRVEPDVTSLVGKNEPGKTSILKALHRLSPARSRNTLDLAVEYPRRRLARDRRMETLEEITLLTSTDKPDTAQLRQAATAITNDVLDNLVAA
jgi:predicted ATP-binding protein involved in virulence